MGEKAMREEATVRRMCDVPLSSGECFDFARPDGRFRPIVLKNPRSGLAEVAAEMEFSLRLA